MSVILDAMRGAVSKDKRRYQKNGFDLDVTPRIIAMGFPSESMESAYRNPMKEVLRCSERGYDVQKFYGRVGLFPFDDHNAPPFEVIEQFCLNVQSWLDEGPQNIAVIHCKAGKGRTGLMICAWLLFTREWKTPEEALDFYASMRTENKKGVTIPSQIRYVRYFHESLTNPFCTRTLLLQRVIFHTLPKTFHASDVNFTIHVGKTLVFTYKQFVEMYKLKDAPKIRKADNKKKKRSKKDREDEGEESESFGRDLRSSGKEDNDEEVAVFECGGVPVCGDVKVDFEKQGNRLFAFWCNTFFVKDLHLVINKEGLDKGHKDKHHKLYEENFQVEVVFAELTQEAPPRKLNTSATFSSSIVDTATEGTQSE